MIVEEVRVIPLGARVQANFPGGVRLGATNPAQFQLEFFVNDLSKSGASTFESLGILQVTFLNCQFSQVFFKFILFRWFLETIGIQIWAYLEFQFVCVIWKKWMLHKFI